MQYFHLLYRAFVQWLSMRSDPLRFLNFWDQPTQDIYFYRFVTDRIPSKLYADFRINFYSVFGSPIVINLIPGDIKVFYTVENLSRPDFSTYQDHAFNRGIDLALGFDYLEHPKYMRFPLWLLYMFEPTASHKRIHQICHQLSFPVINSRNKFACLVSSHDSSGIRRKMINSLEHYKRIDSGGKFMNNTSELKDVFITIKQVS